MRRLLIGAIVCACLPRIAWAGPVGPYLGATCVNDNSTGTIPWTNANNAQSATDADASATAILPAQNTTQYIRCTNFSGGFTPTTLPDGVTVVGLVVEVRGKVNASTAEIRVAHIVKAGVIQPAPRSNPTDWGPSFAVYSVGGSSDLWGTSLTPADIRSSAAYVPGVSGFGVVLIVQNMNATNSRTVSIDWIKITVYTADAGRAYMTGWDTREFLVSAGEDITSGTPPTFTTLVGHTTQSKAALWVTAFANTQSQWKSPASVDTLLSTRAYLRTYIFKNVGGGTDTLPLGGQAIIASIRQCTGSPTCNEAIGCYALLKRDGTTGLYSVNVKFHGKESIDLDFGTFPLHAAWGGATGSPLTLGQVFGSNNTQVACPFGIETGTPPKYSILEQFFLTLADPSGCSGGQCDITGVSVGTPPINAVYQYPSSSVVNIAYDDLVIDNQADPGIGSVRPIFPVGTGGGAQQWSNSGCTGVNCVKDWITGPNDGCLSGGTKRIKSTNLGWDLWTVDDLSPAINAVDTVRAVRLLSLCCSSTSTLTSVRDRWRSGGTELSSGNMTIPGLTLKMLSDLRTKNLTGGAWTAALVNGLELGYEKYSTPGNPHCTAMMAYVDVQEPSPKPDVSLQDVRRCTSGADKDKPCNSFFDCAGSVPCAGDGQITAVLGCDSISASTNTGTCLGGACQTTTCTDTGSPADCPNGGQCAAGTCVYSCSFNSDCQDACDPGAICDTSHHLVNQLITHMPQLDTVIDCGASGQPLHWWVGGLPAILANAYTRAQALGLGTCNLAKGKWGSCTSPAGQACGKLPNGTTVDCDTGATCEPSLPDVVLSLCGAASALYLTEDQCRGFKRSYPTGSPYGGPPGLADNWGERICPEAASVPGPKQAARVACNGRGQCADTDHVYMPAAANYPCFEDSNCPVKRCTGGPGIYNSLPCTDSTQCGGGNCITNIYTQCVWEKCSTPVSFEAPARFCLNDADCTTGGFGQCDFVAENVNQAGSESAYCEDAVGDGSICAGYCERTCTVNEDCPDGGTCTGNKCFFGGVTWQDPVKPCIDDNDCQYCSDNPARPCFRSSYCALNSSGAKSKQITCDDDTDCLDAAPSGWSCAFVDYSLLPYDHNWGPGCDTCVRADCRMAGEKYCTIPCTSLPCVTDTDCSVGALGGICDTGLGKCRKCGAGIDLTPADTAEANLNTKRLMLDGAKMEHSRHLEQMREIDALVEATGAQSYWANYGLTFQMSGSGLPPDFMDSWARNQNQALPHMIDTHNATRRLDDPAEATTRYGGILIGDAAHLSTFGAEVMAELLAPSLNTAYPVCATDTSIMCGYCEVSCTSAGECASGGSTTGYTCAGNTCRCNVTTDCTPGCVCTDISQGIGDKRCRCENVDNCPLGNSALSRTRPYFSNLCPNADCTDERVPPLCTRDKMRCATTADCPGGMEHANVCAIDGVYLPCTVDAQCRNGGIYADPVCVGPIGTPTATPGVTTPTFPPVQKVCMQPTPTP